MKLPPAIVIHAGDTWLFRVLALICLSDKVQREGNAEMHVSRSAVIDYLAQTKGTRGFEDNLQQQPLLRLAIAALGGLAVLLTAAAFLAAIG